jgi:hypothetical protein
MIHGPAPFLVCKKADRRSAPALRAETLATQGIASDLARDLSVTRQFRTLEARTRETFADPRRETRQPKYATER